jgi:ATP/maltotriose-dependent transcriptional regulator MalT
MSGVREPPPAAAYVLQEAAAALAAGRWQDARAGYETALVDGERGEALFGLALALWWLGEPVAAIALEERAFRQFRRAGEHAQAANTALYLCLGHAMTFGNTAAARGWLERGSRIVDRAALEPLAGWMLLCRAVIEQDEGDPVAAEKWARGALTKADAHEDVDLDVCARSVLGAALVDQGRLVDGTAHLDDAMAGALGGDVEVLDSVVLACCRTIASCSRAGDVGRATRWIRASESFNQRFGSPHLHTTCRIHHGRLLFLAGRWAEAEQELTTALGVGALAEPLLRTTALAALAELRLAQGSPEEAQRLLEGHEGHDAALAVSCAVLVALGRAELAADRLRRRIDARVPPLDEAWLRWGLVIAEIAAGHHESAIHEARELAELAAAVDVPLVSARTAHALGQSLLAAGDPTAAGHLERAQLAFLDLRLPYDAARCQLGLARLPHVSRDLAAADAAGALEVFEELGARSDADAAAALLRSLGVRAVRRGPNAGASLTGREREILALLGEGLSNREIAERLFITPKTVEHHVGRVLAKLGLRRRGEAAAWAARHQAVD